MATGTDGERVSICVATAGGFVSSASGIRSSGALAADDGPEPSAMLGGGVYRLTRVPVDLAVD